MAQTHSVTLTWIQSADLSNPPVAGSGYNVYRSQTPGAEAAPPLNASLLTELTYVDTTVTGGQTYDYVVTAMSAGVESVHSTEAQVKVPLSPPTGLSAVAT